MERSKRVQSNKRLQLQAARESLRNARSGTVNRSDQHELKEEEDIFETIEEEKYEELVESRRRAGDFVVDDEGLGYHDDGEEHVGTKLDAYGTKKQLLQDAEDEDNKKLKKKAKYMQNNTMYNYAKTSSLFNSSSTSAVQSSDKTSLDINALLGATGEEPEENTVHSRVNTAPVARRPTIVRSTHRNATSTANGVDVDAMQQDDDFVHNQFDSDDVTTTGASIHEQMDLAESKTDAAKKEALEKEKELELQSSKISLSKTKSKMKPLERKNPLNDTVNFSLQPTLDTNNTVGMISSIDGGGASSLGANAGGMYSTSSAEGSNASAIEQKYWLQQEDVEVDGKTQQQEYMNMYYMDATELHGTIYLFGKVLLVNEDKNDTRKKYVSSCVAVHGTDRNLFVLPKVVSTDVGGNPIRAEFGDVYKELQGLLIPSIIPKQAGGGFRCKKVNRKYAFELESVPREETEYLKVVYSAKHGVPSTSQCNNGKHYEHIFGATSSALEMFLLKRKLMGPCWIKVKNPKTYQDPVSWCKIECATENPKHVVKIEGNEATAPPPLTSMCVSMKTAVNPSTHTHEIIALSAIVHTAVKADEDTQIQAKDMKRFTMIRALGTSCGPGYSHTFPHDIESCIQKQVGSSGVISTYPNERALLSMFFIKIHQEDPDIFASHNLFGFEFEVLFNRAIANKLPGNSWSKIGRLRRQKPPLRGIQDKDATPGRILCDTYKAAKEFLRETTYSLTHLSQAQLNYDRIEVDPIDVPKYFSKSEHIVNLASHTSCDAFLVQRLMLKLQVIPLTKQLTTVSGNLWSRTARGARAERIEMLLLHEFHALKYVLPEKKSFGDDKSTKKGNHSRTAAHEDDADDEEAGGGGGRAVGGHGRKRAKAAYAGGLVLEPKKGLYDTYILLLDFNSLYPSIIQEYDLCFTTVNWVKYMKDDKNTVGNNNNNTSLVKNEDDEDDDEEAAAVSESDGLPSLPEKTPGQFKGVLPRVIKSLVDRRRQVKGMLKKENDPSKRQQLDIRQKALKLTANSMYGCLGFSFSRFYARPIAALVTAKGRESLQRTVDVATNELGLDVIYGDTDSIMVNTNLTDLKLVNEIGRKVVTAVNKQYESLELDIDGVFKSMLLLKKKKYAAVTIVESFVPSTQPGQPGTMEIKYEKEMKGLDLVRRDWCGMSKDAGKYVLDQILSGKPKEDIVSEIHTYLHDLAADIRAGNIDLPKFVVTKGLNKNPRDYPDAKNQPHLQVALRMLAASKPVNIGDHIPYVICIKPEENEKKDVKSSQSTNSNSSSLIASRAYHPDEIVKSNGTLQVDTEWYMANQILPPISRLCEPIEGTSQAMLSTQLGLDASNYCNTAGYGNSIDDLLDVENNMDAWGFTPSSMMDDSERFKNCVHVTVHCANCQEESDFKGIAGVMNNDNSSNGLNCPHCGSMYFGRDSEMNCYCYLSNKFSILTRKCIKKYYDCWLVCDDRMCNNRTRQQSIRGSNCTMINCRGRMLQEYTEKDVHTQLKYFESLVDMKRFNEKKKVNTLNAASLSAGEQQQLDSMRDHSFNKNETEIYSLLKQHVSNTIQWSAYNWIRPSLWSAMFKGKNNNNSSNSSNNSIVKSENKNT